MFEFLTARAAKGRKGQFFTPRHVVEFCVRMIAPRDGERVCDPACGSGAFLEHAARHARVETWGFDSKVKLTFAGADTLPATSVPRRLAVWLPSADPSVARVVVYEQLYRAHTIRRGEKYHRGS